MFGRAVESSSDSRELVYALSSSDGDLSEKEDSSFEDSSSFFFGGALQSKRKQVQDLDYKAAFLDLDVAPESMEEMLDIMLDSRKEYSAGTCTWASFAWMLLRISGAWHAGKIDLGLWKMLFGCSCSAVVAAVLQFVLLRCVFVHLSQPAVETLQRSYGSYHKVCFDSNATFLMESCMDELPHGVIEIICGAAIRHPTFIFLVLIIWSFKVLVDLQQHLGIFLAIEHLPTLPEGIPLSDMIVEADQGLQSNNPLRVFALTRGARLTLLMLVVLPRIAVSMVVFFFGLRWLYSTVECSQLILDALGLQLALDIPDLVAQAMLTEEMRRIVANVLFQVPVEHETSELGRIASGMGRRVVVAVLLMLVTVLYAWKANAVIPQYNGDLELFCPSFDKPLEAEGFLIFQKAYEGFPYGNSSSVHV